MFHIFFIVLSLCTFTAHAVFNPTAGTPLWNIAAESGIIASAIEGTQTRIQQSDLSGGTYTISSAGRYAVVENLTAPAGATTINITADDVYLDLNGFTIDGSGGGANVINAAAGTSNLYIGNGVIKNAPSIAVNIRANTTNVILENIQALSSSAGVGFQIQDTNTCVLTNCATANNALAGISLNTAENVIIKNFSSDSDTAVGISLVDSNNVEIEEVTIFASGTNGVSFSGTTSIVSLDNFEIFQPGSNGISIANNVNNISVKNGVIINPASNAINCAGDNTLIQIEHVTASDAGLNGYAFGSPCFNILLDNCIAERCLSSGFTATDLGNSSWLNCSADRNEVNGFSLDSTGTIMSDLRNQNLLIDNCIAKGNTANGFLIGYGFPLCNSTVSSCKALQNGGTDFTPSIGSNYYLCLFNSTVENNDAQDGGISNFILRNGVTSNFSAGYTIMVDNRATTSRNGAGVNFDDAADNGNVYLGNVAASIDGGTDNYLTVVPITNPITSIVYANVSSSLDTLAKWTNISATPAP